MEFFIFLTIRGLPCACKREGMGGAWEAIFFSISDFFCTFAADLVTL